MRGIFQKVTVWARLKVGRKMANPPRIIKTVIVTIFQEGLD